MRFLARQPVFDGSMQLYGYELLFRNDGVDTVAHIRDFDLATRMMLDTSVMTGLDVLCGNHKAFINCTRETLIKGSLELLSPALVIAEILEDVKPDAEVVAACLHLKNAGYELALDDVVDAERVELFLPYINYIKVDFRQTTPALRADLASRYGATGAALLAEKVETRQEHAEALKLGYRYFQGFFFQKPETFATRDLPALTVSYLRLVAATESEQLRFSEIEEIIKAEPFLCYRLLRYLNSPIFTFRNPVTSVRHALTLLGEQELRRWICVAALVSSGVEKRQALITWALLRARFCELLGASTRGQHANLFFLGLISCLPPLLGLSLEFLLSRLPIPGEVSNALLGGCGRIREIYDIALAYEAGDWESCRRIGVALEIGEAQLVRCYLQAMHWATRVSDDLPDHTLARKPDVRSAAIPVSLLQAANARNIAQVSGIDRSQWGLSPVLPEGIRR